jgi:hypothetical protein
MGSRIAKRSALAAEASTRRYRYHSCVIEVKFRSACPNEGNEPTDECPPEEKVQQKYSAGIALTPGND